MANNAAHDRPDLTLLEPRHVDKLVESIQMLGRHLTKLTELGKDQLAATKENTQVMRDHAELLRETIAQRDRDADRMVAMYREFLAKLPTSEQAAHAAGMASAAAAAAVAPKTARRGQRRGETRGRRKSDRMPG